MNALKNFVFVMAAVIFSAVVAIPMFIPSEQSPPPSSSVVETPKTQTVSKGEIAKRVEANLRNAKALDVTTKVFVVVPPLRERDEPVPDRFLALAIVSHMKKNFLSTEVSKAGRQVATFSLDDGKIVETQTNEDGKVSETKYEAPMPHGIDDPQFGSLDNCLLGNHIFSWVGVPALNDFSPAVDTAWSMREKIEFGEQEKDAVENGRDCYVFRKTVQAESGELQDVVYVDKKRFVVIRWDTIYPDRQRVRRHDISLVKD